jgi:hypothetical protein
VGGTGQYGGDGFIISYSTNILLEDCHSWGSVRKHFYIGNSADRVIVRRGVVRHDRYYDYSDQEAFMAYDASNVDFQNCIAIDGDQYEYYTPVDSLSAKAFTVRWGGGAVLENVSFEGCMSLANEGMIGWYGSDTGDFTIEDSVHWGSVYGTRLRLTGTNVNHFTTGDISGTGTFSVGAFLEGGDPITNSIITNIYNNYGIWNSLGNDYNLLYNNNVNFINSSAGSNSYCSENGNEINPFDSSLKYLPRIESGSDLSGVASDGGDIGANIIYKIGVDGTLWGEEGYDEVTTEPLWPFPNEDIIKEKMAEYTYDDGSGGEPEISGARGFCAEGDGLYGGPITLTSYIWEYLGNECPEEICDYTSDTTPPSAPSGLGVN